jgi:hypothetical protein
VPAPAARTPVPAPVRERPVAAAVGAPVPVPERPAPLARPATARMSGELRVLPAVRAVERREPVIAPERVVRVQIGRIEVMAGGPPEQPAAARLRRRPPQLSLEHYLTGSRTGHGGPDDAGRPR